MEVEQIHSKLGFFHLRLLGSNPHRRLLLLRSDRRYSISLRHRRCRILLLSARPRAHLLLDTSARKLTLLHRCSAASPSHLRLPSAHRCSRVYSSSGVLLNGRVLQPGGAAELAVGDEVLFLRGSGDSTRCGFVVEKFVFCEQNSIWDGKIGSCEVVVSRAESLLAQLRAILESPDPISCLRNSRHLVGVEDPNRSCNYEQDDVNTSCLKNPIDPVHEEDLQCHYFDQEHEQDHNIVARKDLADASLHPLSQHDIEDNCNGQEQEYPRVVHGGTSGCYSDGSTFFLNRLMGIGPGKPDQCSGATLPQLLHPMDSLVRVFIATFTSDVSWFLDYCKIPQHLPVTIACHNKERCWSASRESRTSAPFSSHPNLLLVYPQFPEVIAFGKDRKKHGVACHHPKLIVLQREDSMRVVITSANLVPKQWYLITNTVWWQDFSCRTTPDYSALFGAAEDSESDFSAQLVSFVASLINEVPSQAHWIKEMAKYDFGGAIGHLVASVPGVYVQSPCYLVSCYCLSAKQIVRAKSAPGMFLGSVQASVVGLSHRFHVPSDSGTQLKALSAFLGRCHENMHGTTEVVLKRNTNIPADANAVSVLVANLDKFSEGDTVQLGFLPREVAKWVSPLSDSGFFNFSAFIYPKEALEAAFGGTNARVQLFLNVSKGPEFSRIARLIQVEHLSPLCSLVASLKRSLGLWRLKEVLLQFKWPESLETDFIYGASSIGTSVNPQFLASFAAATGKRSYQDLDSQESDPEWGCWTANHELKCPSIRLLFPTIDRVKNGACGIQLSRYLLSLREKTWQRLRTGGIFHDAIPHPFERIRHPMHVKVARRRFESRRGGHSFGWVYCGSHNFSPAAWGQLMSPPSKANPSEAAATFSGPKLHICNYELGIIFIVPPSKEASGKGLEIDDIVLPFVVPAPKYKHSDRPATAFAMREAMAETSILQSNGLVESLEDVDEDIPDEDEHVVELSDYSPEEKEDERIYAEMLWSQVESSES